MKLEDQVCSLELAVKLKELGVKQESLFCYQPIENEKDSVWPRQFNLTEFAHPSEDERVAAFTVAELGEMFPAILDNEYYFTSVKLDDLHHWGADYRNWKTNDLFCLWDTEAETEANARAKMIIHLIENKLMG